MIVRLIPDSTPVNLWSDWGNLQSLVGQMYKDDLAFVIESNTHKGGNGTRVITSRGIVGWVFTINLTDKI